MCKVIVTDDVCDGSADSNLTDMYRIADVVQRKPESLLKGRNLQGGLGKHVFCTYSKGTISPDLLQSPKLRCEVILKTAHGTGGTRTRRGQCH